MLKQPTRCPLAFNWPEVTLAGNLRGSLRPRSCGSPHPRRPHPRPHPTPNLTHNSVPLPLSLSKSHDAESFPPPQFTPATHARKNNSRHYCDRPAIWSPVLSHQMDHRRPMAIPRRGKPRIPPMAMATRTPGQRETDIFPSLGEAAPFSSRHCVRNSLASKANTGSAMNASVARSNAMAKPHVSVVGISPSTASMLPTAAATHSRTQRRLLSPRPPHLCSLTNTILASLVRCVITSLPCRNRSMTFTPA